MMDLSDLILRKWKADNSCPRRCRPSTDFFPTHHMLAVTTLRKVLNAICLAACNDLQEVVDLLRGGPICPDSAVAVKRFLDEHCN